MAASATSRRRRTTIWRRWCSGWIRPARQPATRTEARRVLPAVHRDRARLRWFRAWRRRDRRAADAISVLIESEPRLRLFVLTRFLHANRYPPPDQVRGHASLKNALTRHHAQTVAKKRGGTSVPAASHCSID